MRKLTGDNTEQKKGEAPKTYLAHRDLDEDVANDQFERLYDVS